MSEVNNENLNEEFEETMDDAAVITVPIDATLSNSGEAADAKAVGDALALKADASQVVNISVNGQPADNQGVILIDGSDIPVSGTDTTKMDAKIAAIDGKTGADIPLTGQTGSQTIAQAFSTEVSKTAEDIQMSSSDTQTVAEAIGELADIAEGVVLSVNGNGPDGLGNVTVEEVAYAKNLTAESAQATAGTFVQRMAGGDASIADGEAYLQQIRGVNVHTGIVNESLEMTVENATREQGVDGISATINRATFVSYVTQSGTITLSYTTDWSADPATYGVTVTGTPISGDSIVIVYVKASRGVISVPTPTAFNATGWNIYNNALGYARVLKYDHGYRIGGTYSAVQFSQTISGTKTTITPVSGIFDIASDGYVWVTGGNSTSTYVTPTHTDWTEGPDVPFEAYTKDTIDLSGLGELFADGLCAVGGTYDVIDFEMGRAIKKIEKLEYSDETIAALILAGRDYDADEDYIYAVLPTADWETEDLVSDGIFNVSDHGIEWFDDTDIGPYTMILYGQNLKDKLANDVLTISEQTLTTAQKTQVRTNIGAASKSDTDAMATDISNLNAIISRFSSTSAKTIHAINAPSASSHFIIARSVGLTRYWVGIVYVGSTGTINVQEFYKGSNTTITLSTNTLTLTFDNSQTLSVVDIITSGNKLTYSNS